jgi:hypothetical protein
MLVGNSVSLKHNTSFVLVLCGAELPVLYRRDGEQAAEVYGPARSTRFTRNLAVLSYRRLIPTPFALVFRPQLVPFRLLGGLGFGIGGNFFPRKLLGNENRVMRRYQSLSMGLRGCVPKDRHLPGVAVVSDRGSSGHHRWRWMGVILVPVSDDDVSWSPRDLPVDLGIVPHFSHVLVQYDFACGRVKDLPTEGGLPWRAIRRDGGQ